MKHMCYKYYEENIKNFINVLNKINKENLKEADKDMVKHINKQVLIFETDLENDGNESAEKNKEKNRRSKSAYKKFITMIFGDNQFDCLFYFYQKRNE